MKTCIFFSRLLQALLLITTCSVGTGCAASDQSQTSTPSDTELLESNRDKLFEIMSSVAWPDGKLDQATHRKFWELMPASARNNPENFVSRLNLTDGAMYQKELWESIRLSARAGRVVKTIGYEESLAKVSKNQFSRPGAAQRAEEMLSAAASGEPIETSIGTLHLTEQEANRVLDGLNQSIARARSLLDPAWIDRGEHLSAASDQPQTSMPDTHAGESDHIDDPILVESVSLANKRLPLDIGNNTRMESVSAGPGRRMNFHFTLTNRTTKDLTPDNISAGRAAQIKIACGSDSVRSFLNDGIAITYSYKTADGADFTSLDITELLCADASGT